MVSWGTYLNILPVWQTPNIWKKHCNKKKYPDKYADYCNTEVDCLFLDLDFGFTSLVAIGLSLIAIVRSPRNFLPLFEHSTKYEYFEKSINWPPIQKLSHTGLLLTTCPSDIFLNDGIYKICNRKNNWRYPRLLWTRPLIYDDYKTSGTFLAAQLKYLTKTPQWVVATVLTRLLNIILFVFSLTIYDERQCFVLVVYWRGRFGGPLTAIWKWCSILYGDGRRFNFAPFFWHKNIVIFRSFSDLFVSFCAIILNYVTIFTGKVLIWYIYQFMSLSCQCVIANSLLNNPLWSSICSDVNIHPSMMLSTHSDGSQNNFHYKWHT